MNDEKKWTIKRLDGIMKRLEMELRDVVDTMDALDTPVDVVSILKELMEQQDLMTNYDVLGTVIHVRYNDVACRYILNPKTLTITRTL